MAEVVLFVILAGAGGLVWNLRTSSSAFQHWTWGWISLWVISLYARFGAASWSPLLVQFLAPLAPAFMLAGALAYAERRVPPWILPAALGVGLLRWVLGQNTTPDLGHVVGLVVEPAVVVVAAWFTFVVARRRGSTIPQKLLPFALLGLAGAEFRTSWYMVQGHPDLVFAYWPYLTVVICALQILSATQQTRDVRARLQEEGERARRALAASELRFSVLADRLSDVVFEIGPDLRFSFISPSVESVLGWRPDDYLGTLAPEWVHEEDREAALRAATEPAAESTVMLRSQHKDGRWRWLEVQLQGFRSEAEARVVGLSRDVTERYEKEQTLERDRETLEQRVQDRTERLDETVQELEGAVSARRHAESELHMSRERYRVLSELGSDFGFGFRVEKDGTLEPEWATESFHEVTGFTVDEIRTRGWRALMGEEHQDRGLAALASALRGDVGEFEARIVTRAGEERWLRSRFRATRESDDGALRLVGASRDVTEQRKLDEHLREVQRLEGLGVLAGGIAHDFNNLLSVILGNSALGLADLDPDSEAARRFKRIRAAAQHGAGLTDQMLTYSGNAPFSPKPIDLSALIERSRDLLEASLSRRTQLVIESQSPLPAIAADETQIQQVLVNLVANAVEALGDAKGTVHVRSRVASVASLESMRLFGNDPGEGPYVMLEVSDNGPGMSEQTRARIFEPFFTTRLSGRGLGLAAVLGIVQGHGGFIALDSEPGAGTTFRVLLPQVEQGVRSALSAPSADVASGRRGCILVVDDDDAVLEVGAEFLKRAGFHVETALGGRAAIEILDKAQPPIDLVVLDLIMPGLDGEETLHEMRQLDHHQPVVITTGYKEDRGGGRFAADEAVSFLHKPYEAEELIARVESALEG